MHQFIIKVKNFILQNLWLLTVPFIILALLSFMYWLYMVNQRIDIMFSSNNNSSSTTQKYIYFSQLNGQGVLNESDQIPKVVAVMIDNHTDAKQIDLSKADIIYEVPVEGQFTRFMAIYNIEQYAPMVGPVRSARLYFLDWVSEYDDAMYMHSGGSPEALKFLRNNNYDFYNADEFAYQYNYWRDYNHYAPHNLFTNDKKWQKLYSEINLSSSITSTWEGWKFGNLNTTSTQDVKIVKIPFSDNYQVEWNYNKEFDEYYRTINGEISIDDAGKLKSDNIIIQFVNSQVIDDYGRLKIDTISNGQARVLRDGKLIYGSWKKTSSQSRTKFYLDNGEEINLKAGKTWVLVVPSWVKIEIGN